MKVMDITNHGILVHIRKQRTRIEVRLQTYAYQYERFRDQDLSESDSDRAMQLNVAYLYHTSLSILEERLQTLEAYADDVREVLLDLESIDESARRKELRTSLYHESQEEVRTMKEEIDQIDAGIRFARKQCQELHLGE